VFFTIAGVIGAGAVLALVARLSSRPIHTYRLVAAVVFVLMLIPDLMLLVNSPFPETTPAGVWGLIALHVAPYLASVILLPSLVRR
jgi:hypothetical protein